MEAPTSVPVWVTTRPLLEVREMLRRVLLFVLVAMAISAPAALAADPSLSHSGRVLISSDGDITVPAGDQADVVVVVNGTATIEGDVNVVVVVDGTANLTGAMAETVVAIRSPVTLGPGTVVTKDVFKIDSLVTKVGDANVRGDVRDMATEFAGLGFVLGPLFILLFIGFALAAIAAGLLVAGLGARQVRAAEDLITHRPVETFVTGLIGVIAPVFLLVALFISVVGVPLALAILFVVWPLVGFLGYIVAGIWIGDWVLHRLYPTTVRERPYLASVVGLVILALLAVVPVVPSIASLFGYGAVLHLAWRTFRGHGASDVGVPSATPAPMPA
jgi:hypothetical protein